MGLASRKEAGPTRGKGKGRTVIDFRQGIWRDGNGIEENIRALPNDRIQNIERWLRGCGATLPPEGLFDEKYNDVDCEMQRRGLDVLPDHEQAYLREVWHISKCENEEL